MEPMREFNGEYWLVGRTNDTGEPWEVMGLFLFESAARKHCFTPHDFVMPLDLDTWLGDERAESPRAYRPLAMK